MWSLRSTLCAYEVQTVQRRATDCRFDVSCLRQYQVMSLLIRAETSTVVIARSIVSVDTLVYDTGNM